VTFEAHQHIVVVPVVVEAVAVVVPVAVVPVRVPHVTVGVGPNYATNHLYHGLWNTP